MSVKIDGEIIESTAGQVTAELERRGIDPARRIFVTIEPDDWLSRGRREIRARIEAAGLDDDDIDRLIKEARQEANEAIRRGTVPTPE